MARGKSFQTQRKLKGKKKTAGVKKGGRDSVCLFVVVCKHDNFRKNYQIGLKFDTPLEGPKRKDKFVNQPHPTKIVKIEVFFVFLKLFF